ncbi:valine--tRNA ligase [Candidatus Microgenomates bacterium]|nr:valine--tRNA ligase [Candidatus Microgenomates bacterium]
MELSKTYNPQEVEKKIYPLWEKSGYFGPNEKADGEPFVIAIPPPNVTGELHMGHALNNTLQDVLVRQKRMEGRPTLWIPGTDHAGIATQYKVEQKLQKEGVSRFDLGREKFVEKVWEWKDQYEATILGQLKKLGVSCDWSRTRFTMDEGYSKAVLTAFKHYWDKGYIYRGERVVNWCPRCHTSLSDLEIEHEEEKTKLYWIKYGPFVLATTRPETKLGDTAVAVHPSDERYRDMVGKKYMIPGVLGEFEITVVADEAVDPAFGSGAIKVTPAHDATDYDISVRHHLPMKQIIDTDGKMMENCGKYVGMTTLEARSAIVADMAEMELIDHIDEGYIHNSSQCYRCHSVIEPIPSLQWFLKMTELVKPAIEAVKSGDIKIIPEQYAGTALHWMENIRDWCISRQIWWGHRLPVWYKQGEISNLKSQISKLENQPSVDDYVVSLESPGEGYAQSEDVLDTWFSSALWPFATLGWPESQENKKLKKQENKATDLERFYPNSINITDRGIINLWEVRMIFSGLEFMGKAPFHTVYINPTVFNREGKRMSKSLGTGIDPLDLIAKYGADATRFGLCYQTTGTPDIKFSEDVLQMAKTFMNKIWNATRFVLMKLDGYEQRGELKFTVNTDADREIQEKFSSLKKFYNDNLEKYRFGQAAEEIYHFFWHQFCDVYIEKTKEQIPFPLPENHDEKLVKDTKDNLLYVLKNCLILLHPIIPFVTEEIYQTLPIDGKKEFLIVEKWTA